MRFKLGWAYLGLLGGAIAVSLVVALQITLRVVKRTIMIREVKKSKE